MGRSIQDANYLVTVALPAANANVNTPSLNLGAPPAGILQLEDVEARITLPANAILTATDVITLTVQHATDNATWVSTGQTFTITGLGGAGFAAQSFQFRLPSNVNQYVNVNAAVAAGGGSNIGTTLTFQLLF